ncbi:vitamin K-dependent gamma-carboxylase [Teleopsis dalmanni]|uniref:vitamin K-dependent gamma-carboxylase-like n=1 Tax=Teleopsis dalmanni TaxID=139649 RepID=UPI0018CD260D|nr:vitamin K-dependent gamma-carboxylase-like [Teleopsis dalmanni]XP_037948099.1 vitamin K-dependent gamma-carboxylase [Teleopsis dalmanni]
MSKTTKSIYANKEGKETRAQKTHNIFESIFRNFSGYDLNNFQNLSNFTNWLNRPVDSSALAAFRIFYGAAMLIDLAEERGGAQLDVRFGEPQHCHFPLFNFISAASLPIMGCLYILMFLGAMGIMLGYNFRLSCLIYIVPYWYIFLLDKPAWNNHSYLFGLVGSILLFTQANNCYSLDKYKNASSTDTVPYWNYFLIKFQFFILYMYAGLKKFTTEWLSGYAMSSLSRHWVFAPFRSVLSVDTIDLFIVHWFTAIFDFSIAFLMTWEKTRVLATPFMLSFHLMNSRLFVIGMFPWVCLAEVPLFFGFDWPRKISFIKYFGVAKETKTIDKGNQLNTKTNVLNKENLVEEIKELKGVLCCSCQKEIIQKHKTSRSALLRSVAILIYCALQLFLPYSHFLTKGYNNWTKGLYGYSWDMMVHSYDTVITSVKIVDNNNEKVHFINPYAYTDYDRWTKYADMAVQYAKCIENNILEDYARDPTSTPLSSKNFSIYFEIWCSMNGRFQQRVFDPRVDLLTAKWSPFKSTTWSLPLLNELNDMRPKLKTIANEVLAWNNYSDVVFVADFPGLTLDNFISSDLTNVTLTILEGNVRFNNDGENETYFLTAGKSICLKPGITHHVTTVGLKPSSYLYTYVNKTMLESDFIITDKIPHSKPILPLWPEFKNRLDNYKKFLTHIGNCLLFLIYGVPIPMELRERN